MAWAYLFGAAFFEVGWMFSLKFLSFQKLGSIRWGLFFQNSEGIITLLPLIVYILFGFLNVYLLALAMKQISTSIAFAVWTAISLVGVKLIEMLLYKEPFSVKEICCIGLIVIGIIGLQKG